MEDSEGLVVNNPKDLIGVMAQENSGLFFAVVQLWLFVLAGLAGATRRKEALRTSENAFNAIL